MSDKMRKTRSQAWQNPALWRWLAEIRIHPRTVKLTHLVESRRLRIWGETRSFAEKRPYETEISRREGLRASGDDPAAKGKKFRGRLSTAQGNRRSQVRSVDFPIEPGDSGYCGHSLGRIPGRSLAERNRSNEWTRHRARETPGWPERISSRLPSECAREQRRKKPHRTRLEGKLAGVVRNSFGRF